MGRLARQCTSVLYSAIGHPKAPTACIFTSVVLSEALTILGYEARPVAAAVEGRLPDRRFGIGHPAYRLTRPEAWKGHVVCMIGDVLIDPTISQVWRHGVASPPLLVAMPADRPWTPDARCELRPGAFVTWQAEGANQTWADHADATSPLRAPAVARTVQRLRDLMAGPDPDAGGPPARGPSRVMAVSDRAMPL